MTQCRAPRRVATRAATCLLAVLFVLMAAAALPAGAAAHRVQRGIIDESWLTAAPDQRATIVRELGSGLRCQVVRVAVSWARAEPQPGQYDEAYLGAVRESLVAARRAGLQLMVLVYQTPKWASDRAFWDDPPSPDHKSGVYYPFYPVDKSALNHWQRFSRHVAQSFRGLVRYYECWCEPNLWPYLYPQRTPSQPYLAVTRYGWLLKRFYRGVKAADRRALVLGGVTAPIGNNDKHRTSPQRFARYVVRLGLMRYMDGYSHHPYAVGPSAPMPPPEARPTFPAYTISLGNIAALLRIVPNKPMYLTEYGYTTRPVAIFGGAQVSEATQAAYVKRAFRYADRFPRIKLLMWEQRIDSSGLYFGLRRLDGTRKPSWYAFAKLRNR
jgi:hypothetical protein